MHACAHLYYYIRNERGGKGAAGGDAGAIGWYARLPESVVTTVLGALTVLNFF